MIHADLSGGRCIKIDWMHRPVERVSICTALLIQKDGTSGESYSSSSRCHPSDRWSKEEARKITLMRLLKQLAPKDRKENDEEGLCELDKEDRTSVWRAYFGRLASAKKDA